jgi:hypothetical protein
MYKMTVFAGFPNDNRKIKIRNRTIMSLFNTKFFQAVELVSFVVINDTLSEFSLVT